MSKKHTFEYVKSYFEEHGCELLEKEYINCKTKMRYRCKCGNISKIGFNTLKAGHRCKKCKERKNNNNKYKKLNAHHIEGYAENPNIRLDLNNGITFCFPCHMEFHSIYGKKNINRQQLDDFLKTPI